MGKRKPAVPGRGGLDGMRIGVPERTRTSDLRLRRPALYPLSYGHRCCLGGVRGHAGRRAVSHLG